MDIDRDRLLTKLSNKEFDFDDYDENAENYLLQNKITQINNFYKFIDGMRRNMELATRYKMRMCENSFFSGSKKNRKEIEIDYKISDFETTLVDDDNKFKEEIILKNTMAMLNSFYEYVECFMEGNTNESEYKSYQIKKQLNYRKMQA
jgi:hypothetical protein